jgi:putative ubiquitin-RnfH superfamily antitoxin RatB of RatAB toxin-antitoxin module
VRLTSNEHDFDPEFLVNTVRLNNMKHQQFNPTLKNKEWSRHFKEVIEKFNQTSVDDKIDFEKEFGIKQRYGKDTKVLEDRGRVTLYNPNDIKSLQDLKNYKRGLCTSRVFKQFKGNIE